MKYGAQSVQYVTFNKIIKLTHFSIVINVRKWTVPKSNISFFLDIELCAQSLTDQSAPHNDTGRQRSQLG